MKRFRSGWRGGGTEFNVGEGIHNYAQEHGLRLTTDESFYHDGDGLATGDSVAYALHPSSGSLAQLIYVEELNRVYAFYSVPGPIVVSPPTPIETPINDWRWKLPLRRESAAPYPFRLLGPVDTVIIHHSASVITGSVLDVANYQVGPGAHLDFPGVAYHYLVSIYETAWCHGVDIRTWGASGRRVEDGAIWNDVAVHICYVGMGTPTGSQIMGMRTAIHHAEERLGRRLTVIGHKEASATECPGDWGSWRHLLAS